MTTEEKDRLIGIAIALVIVLTTCRSTVAMVGSSSSGLTGGGASS
jgi:hypothetical protein